MIPRTLHYCWFGPATPPDIVLRCQESWTRHLPGFAVRKWDESNAPLDHPYLHKAWESGHYSNMSNFMRLHVLFNEGGLYLDTDVEVLKPMDPFLGDACFFGHESSDWLNSAVAGAEPGHPMVHAVLDRMVAGFDGCERSCLSGPRILTETLRARGYAGRGETRQHFDGVTLYPSAFFYPYPWNGTFTETCLTPETHCIHHWSKLW